MGWAVLRATDGAVNKMKKLLPSGNLHFTGRWEKQELTNEVDQEEKNKTWKGDSEC